MIFEDLWMNLISKLWPFNIILLRWGHMYCCSAKFNGQNPVIPIGISANVNFVWGWKSCQTQHVAMHVAWVKLATWSRCADQQKDAWCECVSCALYITVLLTVDNGFFSMQNVTLILLMWRTFKISYANISVCDGHCSAYNRYPGFDTVILTVSVWTKWTNRVQDRNVTHCMSERWVFLNTSSCLLFSHCSPDWRVESHQWICLACDLVVTQTRQTDVLRNLSIWINCYLFLSVALYTASVTQQTKN